MTLSEKAHHEKPGIGCISTLTYNKKGLIASGGFDHRVKVCSAQTMKSLFTLTFHQNIVN